jgi:predicted GNAT family acetyltransferase
LTPRLALLARLQRQVLRGFAQGSEIREGEAFRVHIWPTADPFYRNRALPRRRPRAWPAAIAEMVQVFRAAERTPRLEFFEELWPDLPEALEHAGFACEMQAPVLAAEAPPDTAAPTDGVTLLDAASPDALLRAYMRNAAAQFDMRDGPDADQEARQLAREIAAGRTMAAACIEDGEPVAGGCLVGLGAEAELAGVWTASGHRRRGHALAVCKALLDRFLAGGGELVWLSAGGQGSERLYRRLGFLPVGTQLNYALPAEGAR